MKTTPLKILAVLLLLAACAKNEPSAPMFSAVNTELLGSLPDQVFVDEELAFVPAEAHHFEMKAPQKCGVFPFGMKSPRIMRCQLGEPGTHLIELSVCDDAKTYCKFVKFQVAATAPKGFSSSGNAGKSVLQPPKHEHAGLPGFMFNDPEAARAKAQDGGKLLLIDFYGIWCPPCNMLEEYVYKKKPFLEATDDMVRVMLDADSDVSWEWKAHFKVGGYPTVVIANEKLEEVGRMVGYRPIGPMLKWVKEAKAMRDQPISVLAASYKDTSPDKIPPAARKRIGKQFYDRGEYEAAIAYLEGNPEPGARLLGLLAARSQAGKENDDKAELEVIKRLVREFPGEVEYAGWVKTLIKEGDPDGKAHLQDAFKSLRDWRKSPELNDSGYSLSDLASTEGALYEALKDDKNAKAAYLRAAELYEEMAARSELKVARGANLERAYVLHKAGENTRAKALYGQLARTYADEFTFNYDFAYVLNELKEYPEAYAYVRKAEDNSYGDNWLRAVHLKAKLELALGQKAQARASLEAALREAVIPRSTAVRTHRYIARLRKLLKET